MRSKRPAQEATVALSPEQKATNKAIAKEKRRQWAERRDARRAREAALLSTLQEEQLAVTAARDAEVVGDLHQRALLDAQAAERLVLACRHTEEQEALATVRQRLRETTTAAWIRLNTAQARVENVLAAEFPDLQGDARYSAACWTPLAKAEVER